MKRALLLLIGLGGCSFGLDFDDIDDLPCPCGPEHVCLQASDRCVPVGSAEPFQACSPDTPLGGDELCTSGHRCVALNGQGTRCLPSCTTVGYGRPDDGARVAAQCPFGTTCWETAKGGVCSEGICQDNPSRGCGPQERCGTFNGAGVCFKVCDMRDGADACGGTEVCHPIGQMSITACVGTGDLPEGAICTQPADGDCEKTIPPMICARAVGDTNPELRCKRVCTSNAECYQGETCTLVRASTDPSDPVDVGICE